MSDAFPDAGHTFPCDSATTERAPAFLPRGAALSVLWLYDASEVRSTPVSAATEDRHEAGEASDARDACP